MGDDGLTNWVAGVLTKQSDVAARASIGSGRRGIEILQGQLDHRPTIATWTLLAAEIGGCDVPGGHTSGMSRGPTLDDIEQARDALTEVAKQNIPMRPETAAMVRGAARTAGRETVRTLCKNCCAGMSM